MTRRKKLIALRDAVRAGDEQRAIAAADMLYRGVVPFDKRSVIAQDPDPDPMTQEKQE